MRAVHVSICHDDDAIITQLFIIVVFCACHTPRPAPDQPEAGWRGACRWMRWQRSGSCRAEAIRLAWCDCVPVWRSRQRNRPSTMKSSVSALGIFAKQSAQLARQAQFAHGGFTAGHPFPPGGAGRSSARSMTHSRRRLACWGALVSQWSNWSRTRLFHNARGGSGGEAILGLANKIPAHE